MSLSDEELLKNSERTAEDNTLPDGAFLYVEEGDEKKEKDQREKPRFFVYKASGSGQLRWASISSVAIMDKEFEVVTEMAYDDAIRYAQETGKFGSLDLVHVKGTEVGDCDFMARWNQKLIEGGTWRNTDLARRVISKITEDPERWGVSISFEYDPRSFVDRKYLGNIRILGRSVLPADMAASYGTRFIVKGDVEKMREDVLEALLELGLTPDEITSLAEKNINKKEHVKTKFWERVFSFLRNLQDETEKVADEIVVEQESKSADVEAISQAVLKVVSDHEADREQKITDLAYRLTEIEQKFTALFDEFKRTQTNVEEKALELLNELPKVVKVRATQTTANEIHAHTVAGGATSTLLSEVKRAVDDAMRGGQRFDV